MKYIDSLWGIKLLERGFQITTKQFQIYDIQFRIEEFPSNSWYAYIFKRQLQNAKREMQIDEGLFQIAKWQLQRVTITNCQF